MVLQFFSQSLRPRHIFYPQYSKIPVEFLTVKSGLKKRFFQFSFKYYNAYQVIWDFAIYKFLITSLLDTVISTTPFHSQGE